MLDRAIDGVALADAAEMRAHPLSFQIRRARALVHLDVTIVDERETREHLARDRGRVSSLSWLSNFHSPDSAPKVTSNVPPVHSLT